MARNDLAPSLESQTVDEWAANVRPSSHATAAAGRASRSETPWLLAIGGASAFALLMTFQQVVEGSVRDAPLRRATAERVVPCNAAEASSAGTACTEIANSTAARRTSGSTYAQLAR